MKAEIKNGSLIVSPINTAEDFDRALVVFAFYEEAHPNPKTPEDLKRVYAKIRSEHIWIKWGKCELCGRETMLDEHGLTWVCDDPECVKKVTELNKQSLEEFKRDLAAEHSYQPCRFDNEVVCLPECDKWNDCN